jgi:hypothetical protein
MTNEELVTLRQRVGGSRYVWIRMLNNVPLEVAQSPGGPETMNDRSVWLCFILVADVRKAINTMADPS